MLTSNGRDNIFGVTRGRLNVHLLPPAWGGRFNGKKEWTMLNKSVLIYYKLKSHILLDIN
jgi:hypothetical protein